jgi:nucleolar pre-ribosomal-associated protein 1
MLYGMLYSSSDDWRRERSWILKFIADAMLGAGDEEWKVFRRRHTWDLLAGLFQSGRHDGNLRSEIIGARTRVVCSLWYIELTRWRLKIGLAQPHE